MAEVFRPPNGIRYGIRHRGTWCAGYRGQDPPYPPGGPGPGPGPTGPGPGPSGPSGPGRWPRMAWPELARALAAVVSILTALYVLLAVAG